MSVTSPGDLSWRWHGQALPITKIGGNHWRASGTLDVIWTSVLMILNTRKGSRLYDPLFGSNLAELVFEPSDSLLDVKARTFVADAIRDSGEDRVILLSVETVIRDYDFDISMRMQFAGDSLVEGNITLHRNRAYELVASSYRKI